MCPVWRDYVSCYVADLSIPNYEMLLDLAALSRAYKLTISPMLQLAETNGFEAGWEYNAKAVDELIHAG
jgi:hypothetical protein